jgi:cytochrome c oxidase assembly protein Cox11
VFFLDPALEKDPSMARVDSITLSYTMFAPPSDKPAQGPSADRAGPAG